jgi:nucleoid-associated protein YgaU
VTLEPIASETPKSDTNSGAAGATASAADTQNSAKSGDVDWGKLLNGDQPMLAGSSATPVQQQQQTPAPAGETSTPAAQTATPPAPGQTPAETPKAEPTAASDATNSTAASPTPSQTQTNSANSGSQPTNTASQTTIEPQLTQPANEQVAIANTTATLQQGQSDVLPQATGAPPQMTTVPPGPAATDSTAAVTSATDSSSAVAASSASGKQRTHVIQKNETLSSISLAAYGSANYYPHILRANPGLDDKRMKVGQTIVLPDVSAVKPSAQDAAAGAQIGASGAQNGASGAPVAASAAQIDPAKDYKVVANDSLYRISVKLYGKSDMATKIYELNKQQIGEDPAKLKLGMVLKLPSPPTATQAR